MSDHTVRRIVSLQPSGTVILAELGELKRVVACTKYCVEVCPEAAYRRLIVADSWSAQASEILAAKPELVLAAVPYQEKAVSEILKAGARFLGLAPRTLCDIYTDIATIAGMVGAAERGAQIIARMQEQIESVRAQTRNRARPKVFCEEWGKPIIASQPWVAELVEAAGGQFVGEAGKPTDSLSVLSQDPEVLVAAWCGAGNRVPLEKIVRDRGWSNCQAARARRVYSIRDEFLNTPAPTLLYGLEALAAAIHPEQFCCPSGLRKIGELNPRFPERASSR